jgi:hypothetical protein
VNKSEEYNYYFSVNEGNLVGKETRIFILIYVSGIKQYLIMHYVGIIDYFRE